MPESHNYKATFIIKYLSSIVFSPTLKKFYPEVFFYFCISILIVNRHTLYQKIALKLMFMLAHNPTLSRQHLKYSEELHKREQFNSVVDSEPLFFTVTAPLA